MGEYLRQQYFDRAEQLAEMERLRIERERSERRYNITVAIVAIVFVLGVWYVSLL